MIHHDFFTQLNQQFVLPIIRLNNPQLCLDFCQVLHQNDFSMIEITLTSADAFEVIKECAKAGIHIGAGTVINGDDARRALVAGAQYLVSPGLNFEIITIAQEAGVPYLPGVLTPTEVLMAKEAGLSYLKLFPASSVGPDYLKHLQGPYPDMRFLATGGIQFEDIPEYIQNGAWAVGQGTRLVSKELLEQEQWDEIAQELQMIQTKLKEWKK